MWEDEAIRVHGGVKVRLTVNYYNALPFFSVKCVQTMGLFCSFMYQTSYTGRVKKGLMVKL